MKRSEINQAIKDALNLFTKQSFVLPPFAHWTPGEWETKGSEYDDIREAGLGWDVTDFGSGNFEKEGLLLFTLRNGHPDISKRIKSYAEKVMVVKENQVTPFHYHWEKTEDIINRGGGKLVVKLYLADEEDEFSDESFTVTCDGKRIQCEPGQIIVLKPGESITLMPKVYHSFWGEEQGGPVLVGEVSETNDDNADNRFYGNRPRFSDVEEDEPKLFKLVNEY